MSAPTIIELMDTAFGPWFQGDSWNAWRVALKVLFGLPLDEAEFAIYQAATGRTTLPPAPITEAWFCVGRRGGKSLVSAMILTFLAFFRDYGPLTAPGEVVTLQLVAADRRQARTLLRYCRAFIFRTPVLASLVTSQTKEAIELANGVTIEITTASSVSTRSYTLGGVVNDEIAFWPSSQDCAEPDQEILAAQRPGLSTIPGAPLICISSPYGRAGATWSAFQKHYANNDSAVLFWKAPSRSIDPACSVQMNPSIPLAIVQAAFEQDSSSASSEWHADFRSDIEKLFTHESLEAVTDYDLPDVVPFEADEEAEYAS